MLQLEYPHGIQDIDNMAPFTLIYDEYVRFQICHIRLGEDMNFVVLIRILDSTCDPDGIVTLKGFELIVVHGYLKESEQWIVLNTDNPINHPPVSVFNSEDDKKHHGSIVNFKVKIKTSDKIPLNTPVPVFTYADDVKINTALGQKLHFVMDGLDENTQKGTSKGRMCLVETLTGKRWLPYEEIQKS